MGRLPPGAIYVHLAIAILLGGWLALAASEQAPLTIGMVHWIAWSPLHVAEAEGLWARRGLQVTVINYEGDGEAEAALLAGRIDLAMNTLGDSAGLARPGVEIAILGDLDWSHGGDKIIARRGLRPAALKGGRIGSYSRQPAAAYFLHLFLDSHRLGLGDVEVIEADPDEIASLFIAGRLPLVVDYDPQALRAVVQGDGEVLATSATFPGCMPEGLIARRDRLAAIGDDRLRQLLAGWIEAVEWAARAGNWPRYVELLRRRTFAGEGPHSEDDLRAMLGSVRLHGREELRRIHRPGGDLDRYLDGLEAFVRVHGPLAAGQSTGGKAWKQTDACAPGAFKRTLELSAIRAVLDQ